MLLTRTSLQIVMSNVRAQSTPPRLVSKPSGASFSSVKSKCPNAFQCLKPVAWLLCEAAWVNFPLTDSVNVRVNVCLSRVWLAGYPFRVSLSPADLNSVALPFFFCPEWHCDILMIIGMKCRCWRRETRWFTPTKKWSLSLVNFLGMNDSHGFTGLFQICSHISFLWRCTAWFDSVLRTTWHTLLHACIFFPPEPH